MQGIGKPFKASPPAKSSCEDCGPIYFEIPDNNSHRFLILPRRWLPATPQTSLTMLKQAGFQLRERVLGHSRKARA